MGILDTIIDNKQTSLMQNFEPSIVAGKILETLKDRERKILSARFGLSGSSLKTLEVIGKEQGLTRERVRQIEKALIKNLQNDQKNQAHYLHSRELLVNLLTEHGGALSEKLLFEHLRFDTSEEVNSVTFILHLIPDITLVSANNEIYSAWHLAGFDINALYELVSHAKNILKELGEPISEEELLNKFKQTFAGSANAHDLAQKALVNFFKLSKEIKKNAFGHYGLVGWNEIQPKDVGDKAYLVMKHHNKPEHYTQITELINKYKFDHRKAFKETVHNELIKDKRFILVGRGIYALAEWGFKPGVVADVIKEVLQEKNEPLTREQIVEEVLKKRVVKKNTILVGLSNKKLFKKVGKNTYTLV